MPKKISPPRRLGSKAKILHFLLTNIGRVVTSDEIREASGNASEWARRLRELRNEEGYQILSHNDREDLKPGEYLLESEKRLPAFSRNISKEARAVVYARNGNDVVSFVDSQQEIRIPTIRAERSDSLSVT